MTNKSLHDIIEEDLKKGMSKPEIVHHVKSMPKYDDLPDSTIGDVVSVIRRELNLP